MAKLKQHKFSKKIENEVVTGFGREPANKDVKKTALIICEDSKSSPAYFRKLRDDVGLTAVDVKICGDEFASAPINVFEYGKEQLAKKDSDFAFCLFVFDRDEHHTYDEAIRKIEGLQSQKNYKDKIIIKAITSVPCFELWLKLHYNASSKSYHRTGNKSPAGCLIQDLKQEDDFKGYNKKADFQYSKKILDKTDTAIANSKKLIANGKNSHSSKHHIDPSTLMHELVEILYEIKKSYQQ